MPGALGGNEQQVVAGGRFDLLEVKVEAVAGHQDGTLFQMGLDRCSVDICLQFIGQQNIDQVCLLDSIFNGQRFEAVAFREIIIRATGSLSNNDLEFAVAQVLCLGVPLTSIAENGDNFSVKKFEVGIGVVVDRCRHGENSLAVKLGKG